LHGGRLEVMAGRESGSAQRQRKKSSDENIKNLFYSPASLSLVNKLLQAISRKIASLLT